MKEIKRGTDWSIKITIPGNCPSVDCAVELAEKAIRDRFKDIATLDNIQDIYKAALDLIEAVEKYIRQDISRSTLIWKKEHLKRIISHDNLC